VRDISSERVFWEIPVDFDLLIKGKIVLPRTHVNLREHAVRKNALELLSRIDHVLCVKDVREQVVDGEFELGL
jgi:hypothetical protein